MRVYKGDILKGVMEIQTHTRVRKVPVLLKLPEDFAKRLREISRETRTPMSLLVVMALRPLIAPDAEIPRYTRPKIPRAKLLEEKTNEGGGA